MSRQHRGSQQCRRRQWFGVLGWIIGLMGHCVSGAAELAAAAPDWSRYPEVGIPLLGAAPVIDGRVEDAEWTGAVRLAPLLRDDLTGFADPEVTEYYLAYTADALHMAWRVHRAHGEPLIMSHIEPGYVEGRGVWSSDGMELFFHPNQQGRRSITFVGNAAGAYGDGTVGDGGGTDFAPTWRWVYAARETEFGWEGELSLPFAELDLAAPEPGTVWGLDIWRQNRSPHTFWSQWAFSDRRLNRFARITFLGAAPVVRLLNVGPLDDEALGLEVALANPTATDCTVQVAYGIYRRRDTMARFHFFREMDSGMDDADQGETEVMTTTTPAAQMRNILQMYEPLAQETRTVTLPAGATLRETLAVAPSPAGDYLLAYRFTDEADRVLQAGVTPTVRWHPVHIETTPYFLHAEQLDVRVTVHTDQLVAAVRTVQASLWQAGNLISEGARPIDAAENGFGLSTREIVPGAYQLQVAVADANGGELRREKIELYRPAPPDWTTQQYGMSAFVPPPWTPVQVSRRRGRETVGIWGRAYHFEGSFLPAQIISQGAELFAAPPRLILKADGREWALRGRWLPTGADPEVAQWRWEGRAGKARITAQTRVEFDGFILIDLEVDAAGMDLEQLWVEFPVRNEQATIYQLGHFFNELPGSNVRPYSHGRRRGGKLDEDFQVGFNHGVWIGSERLGMEWTAESAEHWHTVDRGRAIEFERSPAATTLRLRVIDRPPTAEDRPAHPEKLAYRWGLSIGPVRAYAGAANGIYFTQRPYLDTFPAPETVAEFTDRIPGKQAAGVEWVHIFSQWNRDFAFGQPFREAPGTWRRAALGAFYREQGIHPVFYTGWNGLHPNMAMWPYYGEAMRHTPSRMSFGGYKECAYGGFTEYLSGGAAWLYQNLGSRGVYLDGAGAKPCHNPYHGCGFDDPQTGQRIVTRDIFGRRELFKRLYKITHGEVMDEGIVYNHDAVSYLAFESFVSVRHTGEGGSWEFYTDPDQYRASQNPTQWGIPVEHAWRGFHPVPRNLAWGMALIHDNRLKMYPGHWSADHPHMHNSYAGGRGIDFRMWVPLQWFDWTSQNVWYPYYENAGVLENKTENIYASFRLNNRGQMYFNALNVDQLNQTAAFVFNRAVLGLPATLYARDVVTHETYEIQDGRLTLDFLGHSPRVLMIATEPIPLMGPGVE